MDPDPEPAEALSRKRFLPLLLPLLGVLALPACGRDDGAPASRLQEAEFVEVYVALRVAARESASPEEFERERERILERHGTSSEEMLSFVEAHADDVQLMSRLWQRIQERLEEEPEQPLDT